MEMLSFDDSYFWGCDEHKNSILAKTGMPWTLPVFFSNIFSSVFRYTDKKTVGKFIKRSSPTKYHNSYHTHTQKKNTHHDNHFSFHRFKSVAFDRMNKRFRQYQPQKTIGAFRIVFIIFKRICVIDWERNLGQVKKLLIVCFGWYVSY